MGIWKLEKLTESAADLQANLEGTAEKIFTRCGMVEVRVFGSAARGDRRVGSDIDLCVIFESKEALTAGRKALFSTPLSDEALDLILLEREEYERKKNVGGIAFEIFHYGKELVRKI